MLTCGLLLVAAGCATYNSATGRNEVIFISTSQEVSAGHQIHGELSKKHKILKGTDEAARLERIGQKVARVSDRQDIEYQFNLIESDEINAFTVPGGHIYFYTGLFRQLNTDDQIAAVLGHEIGHSAAKHVVKKFQAALGYNVARNVVVNLLALKAPGLGNVAGMGADGLMTLASSSYGRQDEYEADRLGIKYLHLSGYDVNGMIQILTLLQAQDKGGKGGLVFLRTHPFAKDRVVAAQKTIDEVKKKY